MIIVYNQKDFIKAVREAKPYEKIIFKEYDFKDKTLKRGELDENI